MREAKETNRLVRIQRESWPTRNQRGKKSILLVVRYGTNTFYRIANVYGTAGCVLDSNIYIFVWIWVRQDINNCKPMESNTKELTLGTVLESSAAQDKDDRASKKPDRAWAL